MRWIGGYLEIKVQALHITVSGIATFDRERDMALGDIQNGVADLYGEDGFGTLGLVLAHVDLRKLIPSGSLSGGLRSPSFRGMAGNCPALKLGTACGKVSPKSGFFVRLR
jgi:hypothetical protein